MTAAGTSITFNPIGVVHCDIADEDIARRRRDLISEVEIYAEYVDGLRGIEAYSHLFVLFWMDRASPPGSLLHHPRGDESIAETGVFAARGRNHPNPLGLAVAELLEFNHNRLTVRRLDAYDGTPVIDIKPYDHYDLVDDPRVPEWFRQRATTRG
jgi:tRNA-Thr(GGU) m(6)t(6)A37 methyltransferase TsaA